MIGLKTGEFIAFFADLGLGTSTGHMRSSTAAALVGAAVLSTLFFPALGLRLRGERIEPEAVLLEA